MRKQTMNLVNMSKFAWIGTIVSGLVLVGCDDERGANLLGPYRVSRPAHPAMTASVAPSQGASGHVHTDPHAGVPGAPPIGATSGGGGATGATGATRSAGAGNLSQTLAQFGLDIKVPEDWVEEPGSGIRLATIRLPRVEDDNADGEMSITALGGSLEANVQRWSGQFSERPEPVRKEWKTPGGVDVTTVFLQGTFSAGMGPRASSGAAAVPDTILLGAIAPIPGRDQSLFFKCWGPSKTMGHWREAFDSFVDSLSVR